MMRWFCHDRDDSLPSIKEQIYRHTLATKHRLNQDAFKFLIDKKFDNKMIHDLNRFPPFKELISDVIS